MGIPLISKNSLLKPPLPRERIVMSFRRHNPGLSATSPSLQGCHQAPKIPCQ